MHVAVVGGGIFGQVIGWRLAVRGHRVTVVEPLGPANVASASGDRSRLVRALYDERCFAEAGHAGLEGWARWSAELGVRLVETTGVLYFDRSNGLPGAEAFRSWLDQGIAHLHALGASVEEVEPRDAARRWPALEAAGLARVVFEPGGGFGRSALATRTIARAALATGRVTHLPAAARRVITAGGAASGVIVAGADGAETLLPADAVVVAAGFAGVDLVEPFVGRLGIRRLPHWTSYWDVPYPDGADLAMGRLPAWADLGAELYGFPDDGESGFKVAWHKPRGLASGEEPASEAPPTPVELDALRRATAVRFPGLRHATCRATFACAYDATPDERFQIGPTPGVERLVFVGGLSGHGYKHAPSLGESVAALVSGEPPPLDLSPYALRTGNPTPGPSPQRGGEEIFPQPRGAIPSPPRCGEGPGVGFPGSPPRGTTRR